MPTASSAASTYSDVQCGRCEGKGFVPVNRVNLVFIDEGQVVGATTFGVCPVCYGEKRITLPRAYGGGHD